MYVRSTPYRVDIHNRPRSACGWPADITYARCPQKPWKRPSPGFTRSSSRARLGSGPNPYSNFWTCDVQCPSSLTREQNSSASSCLLLPIPTKPKTRSSSHPLPLLPSPTPRPVPLPRVSIVQLSVAHHVGREGRRRYVFLHPPAPSLEALSRAGPWSSSAAPLSRAQKTTYPAIDH